MRGCSVGNLVLLLSAAALPAVIVHADEARNARTKPQAPSLRLEPADSRHEGAQDASARLEILGGVSSTNVARITADGVAGTPAGTRVYSNELPTTPSFYRPGTGQLMADELELASGACSVTHYDLQVLGAAQTGSPTFDVTTELWNGNPCQPGSSAIPNTVRNFNGIPNDGTVFELSADLDPPVAVPGLVWLAVTFGPGAAGDDGGWLVAEEAEIGFTPNGWSERVSANSCDEFFFGCDTYAGFWANVYCSLAAPPTGACCTQAGCNVVAESACTNGVWSGPYTTCSPSPCVFGACCTGDTFSSCAETTQADCEEGIFRPSQTCAAGACTPVHSKFVNDFEVTGFHRADVADRLRADDIRLIDDAPCALAGYEILVVGNGILGPTRFNATVQLWTNQVVDPLNELLDIPGAAIAGTDRTFRDLPADFCPKHLVVGGFAGNIVLPEKVWIVISTTSAFAGPFLGGPAKIGYSFDAFAQFGVPTPGVWQPGFYFNGFNPDGCPDGAACNPAGSFRTSLWCQGDRPTGACCDATRGTCADGVTFVECRGRWIEGVTCVEEPFDPPCGSSACCFRNPLNPSVLVCADAVKSQCDAVNGSFSLGTFCTQATCPSMTCFNAQGDCYTNHGAPGCEDAFCCEKVCDEDDFCCTSTWDNVCTSIARSVCGAPANDLYTGATDIEGQGTFPFDNAKADTDGPPHDDCESVGDVGGIADDLWFCWTSPCTDLVTLDTCGLSDVDTKIAVYSGCDAAPSDGNLVICDDDACGLQSQVRFLATMDSQYLIRVGSFPGAIDGGVEFPVRASGEGQLRAACAGLSHPACPSPGNCCTDTNGPGCSDTTCCNLVCSCDSYCCDTEWDEFCAANGINGDCGAALLCGNVCAATCPVGVMEYSPESGVVDAGWPLNPFNAQAAGIRRVIAEGPGGADPTCFTLCETASSGTPNSILTVSESAITGTTSMYTITLSRDITPGAVSVVTYTDDNGALSNGTMFAHPGNVNGDDIASAADLTALLNVLNGVNPTINGPWGPFSSDIDRSGVTSAADLVALIDVLNGAGPLTPWINSARPVGTGACPPQP